MLAVCCGDRGGQSVDSLSRYGDSLRIMKQIGLPQFITFISPSHAKFERMTWEEMSTGNELFRNISRDIKSSHGFLTRIHTYSMIFTRA